MNASNKCGPMPLDKKAFAEAVDQACCAVASGSATIVNPESPLVVEAWKCAGEPSGSEYQSWAMDYYRHHAVDGKPEKNHNIAQALGLRAHVEHFTCRIF